MEKSYWHICTDGLAREIIFKDVRDYIFGMNGVPALSLSYDITVLAFCLMSNHVHFVVHGVEKDCRAFIVAYKKRLSLIADVGMAGICVKQIDTDDYLLRVIGYVLRNPVGAGLGVMPQFYRWSSASLYFNKDRVVDGITVEDVGRDTPFALSASFRLYRYDRRYGGSVMLRGLPGSGDPLRSCRPYAVFSFPQR